MKQHAKDQELGITPDREDATAEDPKTAVRATRPHPATADGRHARTLTTARPLTKCSMVVPALWKHGSALTLTDMRLLSCVA
jgi:hypothetical protein